MAAGSLYKGDDDDGAITDINITPFVDVVLVLMVIFIVTAKLIVTRGVNIDKPVDPSGGAVQSTLRVSIDKAGVIYVNGDAFKDDDAAVAKIEAVAATITKPKAIIAGDKNAAYGGVMHAIGLVHRAKITAIALENEPPAP
jgi:biopolymer transport protein ExbD